MDSEPVQILVIDERSLNARSLVQSLATLGHDAIVAHDAQQAMALATRRQIALLTLRPRTLIDAIGLGARLLEQSSIGLIYIIEHADDALLHQARCVRPASYLFRPFTDEALRASIELARPFMPAESVPPALVPSVPGQTFTRDLRRNTPYRELSPRELEIFQALVRGERPPTIGKKLFISIHTVRRHVQGIFRKLNVHSQVELMKSYDSQGATIPREPRKISQA